MSKKKANPRKQLAGQELVAKRIERAVKRAMREAERKTTRQLVRELAWKAKHSKKGRK